MNNNPIKDEVEVRAENDAERADERGILADDRNEPPELINDDALEESTALVVQEAAKITITDDETYAEAGEFLVGGIKAGLAAIADLFDPIDDAQKATRKITIAKRKGLEAPLKEAETVIKGNMGAYYAEQQRALKAAEEERLELARKEAEDRAVEEAARLERNGQQEAADERLAAPVAPVVSTPAPQAPKAAGVSVKTKPNFRIVAESKIGREYLMVDKVKIGKVVRAMGVDAERLIGGIEVYEEPVVSARAAR